MAFDVEIKASVATGNAAKLKSHPRTWKSNGFMLAGRRC